MPKLYSLIESTLTRDLENFAFSIKEKVIQANKQGKLIPRSDEYQVWKVDDFEYTKDGVKIDQMKGEYIVKKDWTVSSWTISDYFKKTELYMDLQTKLKNSYNNFQERYLDNLIAKISLRCVEENTTTKNELQDIINGFEKELQYGVVINAIAELDGITLEPESIIIGKGIKLRQTKKSDLEKEIKIDAYRHSTIHLYPSAVLEIETTGKQDFSAQNKIYKIIPILRLFKVGSVKFYQIRMYSKSITAESGIGTQWPSDQSAPLEKYFIDQKNVTILESFCHKMQEKIPDSFIHLTPDASFKDIAYHRYEDALMTNGTIERRIANAIMGLEGIFLLEKEQELSYRLRLRVAKLMSLFGVDPFEVKKIIRDAYHIRSTFVHGGLLTHSKTEELKEKHGTVKNLLLKVLDYLRISIIFSIFMTIGKPKLIDTVDNSFLDEEHQKQLEGFISETRRILGYESIQQVR